MAFYFALLNMNNATGPEKPNRNRDAQRERHRRRRHSIGSHDSSSPLHDYRLLPRPQLLRGEDSTSTMITILTDAPSHSQTPPQRRPPLESPPPQPRIRPRAPSPNETAPPTPPPGPSKPSPTISTSSSEKWYDRSCRQEPIEAPPPTPERKPSATVTAASSTTGVQQSPQACSSRSSILKKVTFENDEFAAMRSAFLDDRSAWAPTPPLLPVHLPRSVSPLIDWIEDGPVRSRNIFTPRLQPLRRDSNQSSATSASDAALSADSLYQLPPHGMALAYGHGPRVVVTARSSQQRRDSRDIAAATRPPNPVPAEGVFSPVSSVPSFGDPGVQQTVENAENACLEDEARLFRGVRGLLRRRSTSDRPWTFRNPGYLNANQEASSTSPSALLTKSHYY